MITSFVPRFTTKFAPETKRNKWYYELMTLHQMSTETVDQYSLRFQRLLQKVNRNNDLVPAALQVRMYLYELVLILTPLVSIDNPVNLAVAMERARTVEIGYNYTPSKEIVTASTANQEVDEGVESRMAGGAPALQQEKRSMRLERPSLCALRVYFLLPTL